MKFSVQFCLLLYLIFSILPPTINIQHGKEHDIKSSKNQKENEVHLKRNKRNIGKVKYQLTINKIVNKSTKVEVSTKKTEIVQNKLISIKNNLTLPSSKCNQSINGSITDINIVNFIDVFSTRKEVKTNYSSARARKKVRDYDAAIKIYFKSLVFKDGCGQANCDWFAPVDYKFKNISGTVQLAEGLLISKCAPFKTIFLSKQIIKYTGMWKYCCGLGMIPAIIETRKELNCIYDAYQNYSSLFKSRNKNINNAFFVNYAEIDLSKRYFIACPDKLEIPDAVWSEGQPDNAKGMQTCIAAVFNENKEHIGLDDVNGLENLNVMCEKVEKPTITKLNLVDHKYHYSHVAKYKNNEFGKYTCENKLKECKSFHANKSYKFPAFKKVNLSEGILITNCSAKRHFFLSQTMLSHFDSNKYCCSIGMYQATIETRAEFNCIYNQFRNYPRNLYPKKSFTLAYYDEHLTGDFKTCLDEFEVPENIFAKDTPDNTLGNQNCINVIFGGFNPLDLGLNDIPCYESHFVMCEKILSPPQKNIRHYNKKFLSNNNVTRKHFCEENACKGDKQSFHSKELNHNGTKGIFFEGCNQTYFFSNTTVRGSKIWEFCCNLSMVPAIIQSRQDMNCIYNAYRNFSGNHGYFFRQKHFFVSYRDYNLNFTYISCPDKLEVPVNLWAPNQPDNVKGDESCVSLYVPNTKNLIGFDDVYCETSLLVLCQGFQSKEDVFTVKNDYANYNNSSQSQKYCKCYKKCMDKMEKISASLEEF